MKTESGKLKTVYRKGQEIGSDMDWKAKDKASLLDALLSPKNAEEMARFLRDLMTQQEIEEFAKRFEAARMLSRDIQYNAIIEKTGLSSATVARIAKWLRGSLGGYRLVLDRISSVHHHTHAVSPARERTVLMRT